MILEVRLSSNHCGYFVRSRYNPTFERHRSTASMIAHTTDASEIEAMYVHRMVWIISSPGETGLERRGRGILDPILIDGLANVKSRDDVGYSEPQQCISKSLPRAHPETDIESGEHVSRVRIIVKQRTDGRNQTQSCLGVPCPLKLFCLA